jgi:hypothetical protein
MTLSVALLCEIEIDEGKALFGFALPLQPKKLGNIAGA